MKKMTLLLLGCLIPTVILFLIGECTAGVVIEQTVKDREGIASQVILYYSETRLRTDRPEKGLTTIMDFKEDRLFLIDHRSKNYVDTKLSLWEKAVAERLKRGMPGTRGKSRKITVRKTGETATINGFRTEKIEVRADQELIEENWVTRDLDFKDVEKVTEIAAQGFLNDFRFEMKEGKEIHDQLKPHGFPIRIKDYSLAYGLGGIDVMEVKRIERRELKDDLFRPPAGYMRIIPEPSGK